MANINPPDSKPTLVKVPSNYPMEPQPGKISLLFDANSKDLYHKFDARSYDNGNVLFGSNQPFIYRYPGETPNSILQTFNLQSRTDDVIRVTKFVASGRGLLFVVKQFLLQGFQPFDETNIYNPTEVILSAASNLTAGILDAPKRHIDKSGGLLGGLAGLVGIQVSRSNPPPSTVAAGNGQGGSTMGGLFSGFSLLGSGANREVDVLPVQNYGEGAGLLRAGTALKARSILQLKWGNATGGDGGGFFAYVKNLAKSIIPQVFGSDKQNFKQRADEETYDWMVTFYNKNTANNQIPGAQTGGLSVSLFGINLKKPTTTRISSPITSAAVVLFKQKYFNKSQNDSYIYNKDEVFVKGNDEQSNITKIFDQFVTQEAKLSNASDLVSPAAVVNNTLKSVIDNIGRSGIYKTNITNQDNFLLFSGNPSKQGYNRLHDISNTPYNMKNNPNSVESTYYNNNIRTLDSIINPNKNYGLAGNGRPDTINTITVLDENDYFEGRLSQDIFNGYTNWNPYGDDLIAFFFYDVVNGKYIPFRATIKGISEANNALWDELRFIGRADALYSYAGFTRNLSFSFTVVINSLIELMPVWNRLNYLASSVKPSRYTQKDQGDNIFNRFIVPPMFMLTIGDLYKYQPIILTTVNISIPESAVWELTNDINWKEWSYMANMIQSKNDLIGKVGQVPREVDVSIACNLLEKELPQVGHSHFGHSIIDEKGEKVQGGVPYLPSIGNFSINIREDSESIPRG